jgi:Spy/CpxP family protein refolding chaperone
MSNAAAKDDSVGSPGSATLDVKLPRSRSKRSRSWMFALMSVAIFASGAISGAAMTRLGSEGKPLASWNGLLERVASRMQRELDLTEQQRVKIERIVRAHQPELDRIRSRTLKDTRSELQQVIEEMSVVLTPEQANRFRSEAQPRLDFHFPSDEAAAPTERPVK